MGDERTKAEALVYLEASANANATATAAASATANGGFFAALRMTEGEGMTVAVRRGCGFNALRRGRGRA
ncbi:hypothetical protein GCM10011585_20490 [Edaphobacter dinghuensis]|uniref:Uncharacterized protein n=1 Tax=Edaphobacter dinghuensis TaxID=1560005 RepID=A0A917HF96_9BACT|nr:hypothetical protein GCM10011585_20490 [Edaphobacter dinghuensis]